MIVELFKDHKVETSQITKLVDDINNNRSRVQSIFTWVNDAQDTQNLARILKELVLEELVSHAQYEKLAQLKELDLLAIAVVIKVSQGLNFLLRNLIYLRKKLGML